MTPALIRWNLYREVAMDEKNGTFYALSVGPGDPELMTIKACRCLAACHVVAAPRTKSGQMLALEIARGAVNLDGKEILPLEFSMSREAQVRQERYVAAARQIEAHLNAGQDVAMVNLGDVSVYATAYYIFQQIRSDGFAAVMLPGVTSFCAVAAQLGRSLTTMDLPLHIIPASGMNLDEALELPGTKVLMKSGSALENTVRALRQHGQLEKAAMVADCGLPTQKVAENLDDLPKDIGYFATIIVSE